MKANNEMSAYLLRNGDTISGSQLVAVLEDYVGELSLDDSDEAATALKQREFELSIWQGPDDASSESTHVWFTHKGTQEASVVIKDSVFLRHWQHGQMLIVGPSVAQEPGLSMADRVLDEDSFASLISLAEENAARAQAQWLVAQYETRAKRDRLARIAQSARPAALVDLNMAVQRQERAKAALSAGLAEAGSCSGREQEQRRKYGRAM